ncbi:MAG: acetyl-CoA hydrolase/transferase C-terminal domain-containing protein [Chitinivorax sp.]
MATPSYFNSIEDCVDALFATVGNHIVLGIPLGIGKPNPLVNALYQRVKANKAFKLKIITALSLEKPHGHSDLEKRFLDPFVERVFGNYPDLDYVTDLRKGTLPANIEVSEFFMKTGDYLDNANAQQHYIYSNYSHVARDMLVQGVNVMTQAVAAREVDGKLRLSLSSNPDVTLDALDLIHADKSRQVVTIAVVNNEMPFMPNDADVSADMFDFVVTDPAASHTLFAPPNMKVTLQDYAIGLHASSLVKDGGTLQIGIGSLGDAIAQSIIVREKHNSSYFQIIQQISGGQPNPLCEFGKFDEGLYGASEMFVNGFMQLIDAGIIRREVFSDPTLQRLLNDKQVTTDVTPGMLDQLLEQEAVQSPLRKRDFNYLKRYGILSDSVEWQDGELVVGDERVPASLENPASREFIHAKCLGSKLRGGIFMHGGFFLGPKDFYQKLRDMEPEKLAHIGMSRIGYINQLYGHEEIARLQRRHARFINTTMMVTLLGAAVSDGLDSGKLVSGVGGQYNFVAMGHALPDARSILMLRSTRVHHGKLVSNIVWNYGHTTIPRHLRDVVITEYGIADLRGQSDSEVIKRLLAVADSRFQDELLHIAKENGKVARDYEIPASQRSNLPDIVESRLKPWRDLGLLPDFPFGTDFTEDELTIVRALQKLKHATEHPLELVKMIIGNIFADKAVPEKYLERMHLEEAHGIKLKLVRKLFVGNL